MDVRLKTAVSAYGFLVVGAFLLVAPWSSLYDHTVMISANSIGVGRAIGSGWFRGGISGLGALDLLVAAGEVRVLWRFLRRRSSRLEV